MLSDFTRNQNIQPIIALDLALLMQLICIAFAVKLDSYISRENRRRVNIIIAILTFRIIEPQFSAAYKDVLYRNNLNFWNTFLTVTGYILCPLVLYLFIRFIGDERWKTVSRARTSHLPHAPCSRPAR